MVKSGTFINWIFVRSHGYERATLVNSTNIENIYTSKGFTVVCLTSGKKLIDRRSIVEFLKVEGADEGTEVVDYGREMQEIEEERVKGNMEFHQRTGGRYA